MIERLAQAPAVMWAPNEHPGVAQLYCQPALRMRQMIDGLVEAAPQPARNRAAY